MRRRNKPPIYLKLESIIDQVNFLFCFSQIVYKLKIITMCGDEQHALLFFLFFLLVYRIRVACYRKKRSVCCIANGSQVGEGRVDERFKIRENILVYTSSICYRRSQWSSGWRIEQKLGYRKSWSEPVKNLDLVPLSFEHLFEVKILAIGWYNTFNTIWN